MFFLFLPLFLPFLVVVFYLPVHPEAKHADLYSTLDSPHPPTSILLPPAPHPQVLPPTNLYNLLINRIHQVKHGPFHEHSSQLYSIATGVKGWGKVNSGLFKMYEVGFCVSFPPFFFWFGCEPRFYVFIELLGYEAYVLYWFCRHSR
jgi:hypothetical protein